MTDNEPTVRYWRHDRGHQVITETELLLNSPERRERYVEVVVMTPAELAAHTTAARADAWDEGCEAFEAAHRWDNAEPWQHLQDNPYRTPDLNGDNT